MFARSDPHIRVRFAPDRAAARTARRTALLLGSAPGLDEESSRLSLVISELVTNVIDHTANGGCLSVWAPPHGATVRIEVADMSPEFPVLSRTGFDSDRVHGLQLVNHYCARWGVVPAPDGKVVWAELHDAREPASNRFDGSTRVMPARPIERTPGIISPSNSRLNGCLIADVSETLAELIMIGEFDLAELHDIVPTILAVSHKPPPMVTIDMGGVGYIGAAGIRIVVGLADEVLRRGSSFQVVGASRLVDSVIEATGCHDLLGDDHRRRGFKPR